MRKSPRSDPLFMLFEEPNNDKEVRTNVLLRKKHHAFWTAKWKLYGDDESFMRYLGSVLESVAEDRPRVG